MKADKDQQTLDQQLLKIKGQNVELKSELKEAKALIVYLKEQIRNQAENKQETSDVRLMLGRQSEVGEDYQKPMVASDQNQNKKDTYIRDLYDSNASWGWSLHPNKLMFLIKLTYFHPKMVCKDLRQRQRQTITLQFYYSTLAQIQDKRLHAQVILKLSQKQIMDIINEETSRKNCSRLQKSSRQQQNKNYKSFTCCPSTTCQSHESQL